MSKLEETRQRWFLFYKHLQLFEKIGINKIWVNQNFKIYFDYIKNNSCINLGDEIHIRNVWSWSMQSKHTMSHIFYNLEEMKKKRRNQLIFSLLNIKLILKWWNAIGFRWSGEQEENIVIVNFIENYKSKMMRKIFQKNNWMIVLWLRYCTKLKLRRSFYEVISNTKIFKIKFCSIKLSKIKILSNLHGIIQKGTEKRQIRS